MKYFLFWQSTYTHKWNSSPMVNVSMVRSNIEACLRLAYPFQLNCINDNGIVYRFTDYNSAMKFLDDFYDQQAKKMEPVPNPEDKKVEGVKLVDTNLKTAAAAKKARLSDVPPVALFALGAAMSDGATKYGRFNFRETGSTSSVFYDAMMRHLADWYSGEDCADDSKVNHLGHIMASCAILLDCQLHGKLNDDRMKVGAVSRNKQAWSDC